MLKVAMIGFGGIAQSHRYAYWFYNRAGLPVQLVAACDTDPEKFKTVTKINIPLRGKIENEQPFTAYTDWREMLLKEQPDLVDICLPTKFHKPVAIEVLKMGFHVMCEKPMAETHADCLEMVETARAAGKQLMIAQCVRFQPEYEFLHKAIDKKLYGELKTASFYRYSPIPTWSRDKWREEAGKTGSCLAELNIHDIDVIQAIFGVPQQVSCDLQSKVYPYDYADTVFVYPTHRVSIKSAWYDEDYAFNAGYEVAFENGVLMYKDGQVSFTDHDGVRQIIEVEDADGVMGEIRYLSGILNDGAANRRNPPEESARTIYTLEKLFESADAGGKLLPYWRCPAGNRLSFYTPPLPEMQSYYTVIDTAAAYGVPMVECLNLLELETPDLEKARQLRAYADSKQVKFSCLSVFCNLVGEKAAETVETVKAYADVATVLGAPYLHHTIVCEYSDPEKVLPFAEQYFHEGVQAVREIYDYAEKRGVKTIFEDQGYLFNGVKNFGRFLQEVDRDVGVVADVGNIIQADETIMDFIPPFMSRICHVHIKDVLVKDDNDTGAGLQTLGGHYMHEVKLGTGEIPLKAAIRLLKDAGYQGCYALETCGETNKQTAIVEMLQCACALVDD